MNRDSNEGEFNATVATALGALERCHASRPPPTSQTVNDGQTTEETNDKFLKYWDTCGDLTTEVFKLVAPERCFVYDRAKRCVASNSRYTSQQHNLLGQSIVRNNTIKNLAASNPINHPDLTPGAMQQRTTTVQLPTTNAPFSSSSPSSSSQAQSTTSPPSFASDSTTTSAASGPCDALLIETKECVTKNAGYFWLSRHGAKSSGGNVRWVSQALGDAPLPWLYAKIPEIPKPPPLERPGWK